MGGRLANFWYKKYLKEKILRTFIAARPAAYNFHKNSKQKKSRKGGVIHMGNNRGNNEKQNSILIKDGNFLQMQGVLRVDDFDKDEINLATNLGPLVIKGRELHIAQLLLENEELAVEGEICSVCFEEPKQKKQGGFFKRLTK